jgi:DNA-binding PadR family transcriptional regulator
MNDKKIPALGYALLGLLQMKPASGYDLRKIFSSTSMKTYSDSPGAIYPALSRLERQGLIRGRIERGSGLRRRQVFRPTPKGLTELEAWIIRPVAVDDLVRGQQDIMLRFAFSESAVGRAATLTLLQSLEIALNSLVPALHKEFDAMKNLAPTSGRLAFECGVRGYESLAAWTRHAIATYGKEDQRKGKRSLP